jgi:hypothetical protein
VGDARRGGDAGAVGAIAARVGWTVTQPLLASFVPPPGSLGVGRSRHNPAASLAVGDRGAVGRGRGRAIGRRGSYVPEGAGTSKRTAPLPVRPDRTPTGAWAALALTLALAGLAAFAGTLAAWGGVAAWQPSPLALATLHLFVLAFLVPVALAALSQLGPALFARAPTAAAWTAPAPTVAWLGGVAVAFGLARPGPVLMVGGALVTLAILGLVGDSVRRLGATARSQPDLALGMLAGATGLLATLVAGALAALGYSGLGPAPPVGVHLALATAAAFVPLLLATSQQLFAMFARCPPLPRPLERLGPAALAWVGAVTLAVAAALAADGLAVVGAGLSAVAVSAWAVLQEGAYRRRQGRERDPAAWGARLAAAVLAVGAWLGTAGLAAGDRGEIAAAVALALVGGIGGSIVAYLRRILPFTLWYLLFRRFGRAVFVPRLDGLRLHLPARLLPVSWALGAAIAAWEAGGFGPAGGTWGLVRAYGLWVLAAAALLAVAELGYGPCRTAALLVCHRREARADAPPTAPNGRPGQSVPRA